MNKTVTLLKKIVPELLEHAMNRLFILDSIATMEPIGRRALANYLQMSERTLRAEVDLLKKLSLIDMTKNGMYLTENGKTFLTDALPLFETTTLLMRKEQQLKNLFNIAECRVVPGDFNKDHTVFERFGAIVSSLLASKLPKGENTIAVTGGTTLSYLVPYISEELAVDRQFKVVAARGGGIGTLTIQANAVSHELASRLHGENRSLFVPEQLSAELHDVLLKDISVAETLDDLKQANCLIYSLGNAAIMGGRRGVSAEELTRILDEGAVGEVLGVFFDKNGKIVHRLVRIGLVLEDLSSLPCEVLVVGGSHKADALTAYMKLAPRQTTLVVDEGLANMVLKEATL